MLTCYFLDLRRNSVTFASAGNAVLRALSPYNSKNKPISSIILHQLTVQMSERRDITECKEWANSMIAPWQLLQSGHFRTKAVKQHSLSGFKASVLFDSYLHLAVGVSSDIAPFAWRGSGHAQYVQASHSSCY